MHLRTPFSGRLAMLCLLVLAGIGTLALGAPAGAVQTPTVDLHQSPTGGKTPVVVSLGLYVTNLVAIDEARETFEVAGYVSAKWQDPRLTLPFGDTSGSNQPRTFKSEDIWTPPIEGANAVSHKTNAYFLEVDKDGTVSYLERFDATLSSGFNLRKFPFDTQVLEFDYQPFASVPTVIQFAPQALPGTGVSPEPHTELAAWSVKELRYTANKMGSTGFLPLTGEAIFQIVVKRRSGFYIWKIFLPLFMLTLVPVAVFWLDAKDIDWMLKVPMTMLLSMVAFEFTIARDLPRIGYVTFLDAAFLASFAFCFVNILEITLVYVMQRSDLRAPAVKLHTVGRWAYPLAYLVVILLLSIGFLA
jgi:hypothetical protein